MIRGLNHLTLAVRDLDRAVRFYVEGLGAPLVRRWPFGAYLTLGDLWLCLSLDPLAEPGRGYTHAAFDVAAGDLDAVVRRLRTAGAREWKRKRSEDASHYFLNPEEHRLELHVGTLESRIAAIECCL